MKNIVCLSTSSAELKATGSKKMALLLFVIGGASTGANCRLMPGGDHPRWSATPLDPGGLQHPSEVTINWLRIDRRMYFN
jgi:hypothetical protein